MAVKEKKTLKSIAFDLDTKALQEHYKNGDWHNAYNDISSFLGEHKFKHMQGSVYDSTTKFSDRELGDLIQTMGDALSWLPQCVKSIRGYDQPVMIDYTLQLKDRCVSQDLSLSNETTKDPAKILQEKVRKASQNLRGKDINRDLER